MLPSGTTTQLGKQVPQHPLLQAVRVQSGLAAKVSRPRTATPMGFASGPSDARSVAGIAAGQRGRSAIHRRIDATASTTYGSDVFGALCAQPPAAVATTRPMTTRS